MAGHIIKITIEDTHPPIWRRVVVPEKITFADMHEIIKILFGWEDMHLHNFTIPSKHITIDNEGGFGGPYHYSEDSTLLEEFLLTNKWIRYTYDFGDEWRHRIVFEKTDEDYDKRYVTLIKFKGDNFEEDCGGVWAGEQAYSNRKPFDGVSVNQQLSELSFPAREGSPGADGTELLDGETVDKIVEGLANIFVRSMKKRLWSKGGHTKDSRMKKRAQKWDEFICGWDAQVPAKGEDTGYVQLTIPGISDDEASSDGEVLRESAGEDILEIVSGSKTQEQLLAGLSIKETEDYCKYLRIPIDNPRKLNEMYIEIVSFLRSNPEYILYVIDEEEYQELLRWLKLPCGMTKQAFLETDVVYKAIALGLADFSMQKVKGYQKAKLSFASDIQDILSALNRKFRKKVYIEIDKFSKILQELLFVYGVVEIEELYNLYTEIYRMKTEREHFLRLLYWHARFTGKLHTFYLPDGTSYASLMDVDADTVLRKMNEFTGDLEYVKLPAGELKRFADDILADNEWKCIVYSIFWYHSDVPKKDLENAFGEMLLSVFNGGSLAEVLKPVYDQSLIKESQLADICEIWTTVSGMMLEQRLPMLKGRSRVSYAEEKDISPWQVGMVEDKEVQSASVTCPMYGFPAEIQEMMYSAVSFADRDAMRGLLRYKSQNGIQSEEFLYLLAEAHVTGNENKRAEKLIRELESSSERGKAAAEELREALEYELEYEEDIWDYYDDNLPLGNGYLPQGSADWPTWDYGQEPEQMPYVRENPKVGRNDPCPCGSGKKYKKCCGKGK